MVLAGSLCRKGKFVQRALKLMGFFTVQGNPQKDLSWLGTWV
jgi:hypothetical protein